MKSGASDPFAEDTGQDEQTEEPDSGTGQTEQSEQTEQPDNSTPSDSNTGQFDSSDLPFILRRDTVKEDRDDVHQLFVLEETDEKETEARRELEDRLGDVYKLDAREAIYRAGMENIDDAEEILRDWGIDL